MLARRPRLQLLLVSLLALASLIALTAVHPDLSSRELPARGDELALSVAWTVATAAAAWLFVATGASAIALGLGRPHLARRLAPALPAGIRRVLEIAIVASCVAVPVLPAAAVGMARSARVAVSDQPVVRTPRRVAPAEPAPIPRSAPRPSTAPSPSSATQHVVVRAGDSLWLIARAALENVSAVRVDDSAVARYWRAVIVANRSTLRSGDPSLIFPGEVVTLPPPGAVS